MKYSELTAKQKKRSNNVTCRKFDYENNHLKAANNPTGKKETRDEFANRFWDERRLSHTLAAFQKELGEKARSENVNFPDTTE